MAPPSKSVDFLILTALDDELSALRKLGDPWQEAHDSFGLPFYTTTLRRGDGSTLSVAAAWAGEMGETPTASRASTLALELSPSALGMCGICAGKRGDTSLGNVIVADAVYSYDHGKIVKHVDNDGVRREEFFHSIRTYNLPLDWKMSATELGKQFDEISGIAAERPLSLEVQRTWLARSLALQATAGGAAPYDLPERASACPDWSGAIDSLRKRGYAILSGGTLTLTDNGLKFASEHLFRFPNWAATSPSFTVHVATIATGKTVQEDPFLFDRLKRLVRGTLGVEMEATAIAHVGYFEAIPTVIVKAVSDHADDDKDDSFRAFACKASALFLLEFAKRNIAPGPNNIQRRLTEVTSRWSGDVGGSLADELRLPRTEPTAKLAIAHREHRSIAVLGTSGSGKSSLVRNTLLDGERTFAMHADELLSLDQESLQAFVAAQRQPATLIVDAAERLTSAAETRALARVIRAMALGSPTSAWRLVVTCQALEWDGFRSRLEETQFSWGSFAPFNVEPLRDDELPAVGEQFPRLRALLASRALRPLTTQLKLLDMLCTASRDGDLPSPEQWVGEASFLEWFWTVYLQRSGRDQRHVVALQNLAKVQGDAHAFTTPNTAVPPADLPSLVTLQSVGIVRIRDDTIRFTHDVYADYARARYLVSHLVSGNHSEVALRIGEPMWRRATRLASLHFLESKPADGSSAIDLWSRVLSALPVPRSKRDLAFDWFAVALPYSSAPVGALDQLWPMLRAKKGRLLRRALGALLFEMTIPAPEVMRLVDDSDVEQKAVAEARYRSPLVFLWPGIVRALVEHSDDVLALAPDEFLAFVEPWLLFGRRYDVQCSAELTGMVLTLAERTDASERSRSPVHDTERLWFLVMIAGPRHGDRFRALLRMLSGLTPQAARSIRARSTAAAGTAMRKLLPTVRIGPWPNGPNGPPNPDFVKRAMQPITSKLLVEFDPVLAREVFVALLINPPEERFPTDLDNHEYELRSLGLGFKPTHQFPPVRALLEHAPAEAITTVAQLADHAVQRQLAPLRTTANQGAAPVGEHVDLLIDGTAQRYSGNAKSLHWHLPGLTGPKPLTAALMTVEQWLYEQVDATRDSMEKFIAFEAFLTSVRDASRSTPLLGVCFELGLYHPGLLAGCLTPLSTSAELLLMSQERLGTAGICYDIYPPTGVRDFVAMPHRRNDPRKILARIFLAFGLEWPAMAEAQPRWREELKRTSEPRSRRFYEQLLHLFDPTSWEISADANGKRVASYTAPEPSDPEALATLARLESATAPIQVLRRCRAALQGTAPLGDDDLLALLQRVSDLRTGASASAEGAASEFDGFEDLLSIGGRGLTPNDTLHAQRCAVARVALGRGAAWFDAHPSWHQRCVAWVIDALAEWVGEGADLVEKGNEPWRWTDSTDVSWDSFAAESFPITLASSHDDPEMRSLAVALVCFPRRSTVSSFFRSAALHLPAEQLRPLLHLGVTYAVSGPPRGAWPSPPQTVTRGASAAFRDATVNYVRGALGPLPDDWGGLGDAFGFEEDYLATLFAWLTDALSENLPPPSWMFAIVRSFSAVIVNRFTSTDDAEPSSPGDRVPLRSQSVGARESDKLVITWSAIATMRESNAAARRAWWLPWIGAPLECESFIEEYLDALYETGLDRDSPLFTPTLIAIVDYLTGEGWLAPGAQPPHSSLPDHLLGRCYRLRERWTAARAPVAVACRSVWNRWIRVTYGWTGCLQAFCELLKTDAFAGLRDEAVEWLGQLDLAGALRDERAQSELVGLLEQVANTSSGLDSYPARKTLSLLVTQLAQCQNRRALVLQTKLG